MNRKNREGVRVGASPDLNECNSPCTGGSPHLRAVQHAFPSYSGTTLTVPSTDGSELYVFNEFGQHQLTLDPVTGATLRSFQYDAESRVTSITETRGGTTTLTYSGNTVTITPPFSQGGQKTVLTLDQPGGHAIQIATPQGEITQMTYRNGLMETLVDPRLGVHQYTYDGHGLLLNDSDALQEVTTLKQKISSSLVTPTLSGEPFENWTSVVTTPMGHATTHTNLLLSNGSFEQILRLPSGATRSAIHTTGNLWTNVDTDGTQTSTQLAPDPQFGLLDPYPGATSRSTPSGLTYASVHTRTSTGSALAPSTITDLTTINGQSAPWSRVYAGSSRQWLNTSPAGRQTLQQLDSLGRVSSISYPGTTSLPTTSFVYDADGRVSSVTMAPGANGGGATRVTTNTYDSYLAGYLATSQDPVGNVTTYDQRDQDGRVLDVELPDFASVPQSHVSTTYDPNGNVTSVTVPPATSLPSTHAFTNTLVDEVASYTPPQVSNTTTGNDAQLATRTTSYTYDKDKQPTLTNVPEGSGYQAVAKTYDAYGRLGTTYDPLANVTATYGYVLNGSGVATDQVGSVVTSDGVAVTNSFDGFLKTKTLWSSSSVAGSVNWTYDSFFRPATLQVSSAPAITFAYDLDSLYVGTSTPAFAVTRDQTGSSLDGLPYASTLGTVSDSWTYDGFGAQSSYTVKTSDGTVLYAMYGSGGLGSPITRDANGRITQMTEVINGAIHTWAIAYDARGRLASVTRDGTATTYAYDPNGNLTQINGATFGTYDAQDRLIDYTAPGGAPWTLSYTNNGDLEVKSGSATDYQFDYDLSSNLRGVQITGEGSASVRYVIDGMNRRVAKDAVAAASVSVNEGLLYDPDGRVVAELDGSNNVLSTFVYGLKPNVPDYMVRGGTPYRIVSDWRGDVRLVLDTTKTGAAAVVQQIDYDEWGSVTNLADPSCSQGGTALCSQPFGFAGGVWDVTTGIVRFGLRDYDASQRRWSQHDPILFAAGQQNLYQYAGNDPVNGTDASGLFVGADDSAAAGAAALAAGAAAAAYGLVCLANNNACKAIGDAALRCLPWVNPNPKCEPCGAAPPGDIRVDIVPPSKPHYPCPGSHITLYFWETNQNPETCECKYNKREMVICL